MTAHKCTQWFSSKNLRERNHLEALGTDGRIVLNCMLNRMKGCGLDSAGSEHRAVVNPSENGNKP
jgi:hypothetical protein